MAVRLSHAAPFNAALRARVDSRAGETPPIRACTNTEEFAICVHSLPEVAPLLRLLCLL